MTEDAEPTSDDERDDVQPEPEANAQTIRPWLGLSDCAGPNLFGPPPRVVYEDRFARPPGWSRRNT